MQLSPSDEYLSPADLGTHPSVTPPRGPHENQAWAAALPEAQALPASRACHPIGSKRAPRGACTHEQLHALQQQRLKIQAQREAQRDLQMNPSSPLLSEDEWQRKMAAEREDKLASAALQAQQAEKVARGRAARAEADRAKLLAQVQALRDSASLDEQTTDAISKAVAAAMSHPAAARASTPARAPPSP